ACAQFRNVDFAQILFTADSLKDVDNYDERDFGIDSHLKVLKIATKVIAKLKN
ncbi:nucleoside phosphorylase, partial [Lactobacillus crispatus]